MFYVLSEVVVFQLFMKKSPIVAVSALVLIIAGSVAYYFNKNREQPQVQSISTEGQLKNEDINFGE